jgi:ER-derived vesicles protein
LTRRYLPAFGRFLIVVTFLEDALRIITQFGDQIYYLITYRRFLPWGIAHIFLIMNVCVSHLYDNANGRQC